MTVDGNDRSRKPKGPPGGGQYDSETTAGAADDVMPPVPPHTSGTIRITGAGTGG